MLGTYLTLGILQKRRDQMKMSEHEFKLLNLEGSGEICKAVIKHIKTNTLTGKQIFSLLNRLTHKGSYHERAIGLFIRKYPQEIPRCFKDMKPEDKLCLLLCETGEYTFRHAMERIAYRRPELLPVCFEGLDHSQKIQLLNLIPARCLIKNWNSCFKGFNSDQIYDFLRKSYSYMKTIMQEAYENSAPLIDWLESLNREQKFKIISHRQRGDDGLLQLPMIFHALTSRLRGLMLACLKHLTPDQKFKILKVGMFSRITRNYPSLFEMCLKDLKPKQQYALLKARGQTGETGFEEATRDKCNFSLATNVLFDILLGERLISDKDLFVLAVDYKSAIRNKILSMPDDVKKLNILKDATGTGTGWLLFRFIKKQRWLMVKETTRSFDILLKEKIRLEQKLAKPEVCAEKQSTHETGATQTIRKEDEPNKCLAGAGAGEEKACAAEVENSRAREKVPQRMANDPMAKPAAGRPPVEVASTVARPSAPPHAHAAFFQRCEVVGRIVLETADVENPELTEENVYVAQPVVIPYATLTEPELEPIYYTPRDAEVENSGARPSVKKGSPPAYASLPSARPIPSAPSAPPKALLQSNSGEAAVATTAARGYAALFKPSENSGRHIVNSAENSTQTPVAEDKPDSVTQALAMPIAPTAQLPITADTRVAVLCRA